LRKTKQARLRWRRAIAEKQKEQAMMKNHTRNKTDEIITQQAMEQVVFLKHNCDMRPADIIRMYGGQPHQGETYQDAIERVAIFNMQVAAKNGFVA
jgi:hypothetical protein